MNVGFASEIRWRRAAAALCLACSWLLTAALGECPIQLRDVTRQTGVSFVHTDGSSGRRYIVETVCCGLALFDYDGDGDVDVYFGNGAPLPGTKVELPPKNALFRNDGGWKFTDVTERAGLGDPGYALGICTGDYDNDGDQDVYLSNFGTNVLYRNNGDGTFADVTRQAGVDNGRQVGAGACFLDADSDGDLDLYVSNYVDFTCQNHQITHMNGFPAYVGPHNYRPAPDALYRNNGDGTFTDASKESGVAAQRGTGMGMICADYDNDGDTDIFVGEGAEFRFHRLGGSNNLAFTAGSGGDLGNPANVNDGAFHHIVGVHDPSNLLGGGAGNYLYIDNAFVFGNRGDVVDNNQPLMIGENPDAANREWEGQIDDMAFWNRPLTAAEINEIFQGGLLGQSLGDLTATTAIPEPNTCLMLGLGILSVGIIARRRRRKRRAPAGATDS